MTAKGISSGVEKIAEVNKAANNEALEGLGAKWREMRGRIDALLLSNNVLKTDEARRACLKLDDMTPQQRVDHIRTLWGPMYLARIEPMLHQLQILEHQMAKQQP